MNVTPIRIGLALVLPLLGHAQPGRRSDPAPIVSEVAAVKVDASEPELGRQLQQSFVWLDSAPAGQQVYAVFRKQWALDGAAQAATLRLFADSRYILWINGQYVDRGPSRFDPIAPEYDTLDVRPYLKPGTNVIAVLVHHYHDGKTSTDWDSINGRIMRHAPGVTARLKLHLADGQTAGLATDGSWRGTTRTRFLPSPTGRWEDTWSSIPDRIDARLDSGDWTQPEFDDSGWEKPVSVDGALWGALRPRGIPRLPESEVGPLTLLEYSPEELRAHAARWIWTPEPDYPAQRHPRWSAPEGDRFFRRCLELPVGATNVVIWATADNEFDCYFNGHKLGNNHGDIEDYSCLWVQALREYDDHTGDLELARTLWPALTAQLQWFLDRRTTNGLVKAREFVCFGNPLLYTVCEGATLNAFLHRTFQDASFLADRLGRTDQAAALDFDFQIPPETSATVALPLASEDPEVELDGQPVSPPNLEVHGRYAVLAAGPGHHHGRGRAREAADDWAVGPFVKHPQPVLSPRPESSFRCPVLGREVRWEAQNVYNPAAVVRDGKIHLFYRADDRNPALRWGRTCRIGMAWSEDGTNFTRHPTPVLYPDNDEWKKHEWEGGCEDLHIIEDESGTAYMNYTTWSGSRDTISIATSRDLVLWKKHGPAFAKAGKADGRSGVVVSKLVGGRLIAAKVNGKYWMYYTHPCAVAWSTNLIDWTPTGKSVWPGGGREAGAIALLRDDGILLMTQGGHPRLGAWTLRQSLISHDDLFTILKDQPEPFLWPELDWEKEGFTGDATVANTLVPFNGRWWLYYGGADRAVGLATHTPPGHAP